MSTTSGWRDPSNPGHGDSPTSLPPAGGTPTSLPPTWGTPTSLPPTWGTPTSLPPTWGTPTSLPPTWGTPTSLPPTYATPRTYPEAADWSNHPTTAAGDEGATPPTEPPAREPTGPAKLLGTARGRIGVAAVVGLLALALGVGVALWWRSAHPRAGENSPFGAATRFYAALAANDAAAAMREAAPPVGDTSALTDAVLADAHRAAPVGPATVTVQPDGSARVGYTVAGTPVVDELHFSSDNGIVRIADAYASVDSSAISNPSAPLTIVGRRAAQGTMALFPGRYTVGAGTNLTYGDGTLTAAPGARIGAKDLPLTANPAGVTAFRAAAQRQLDACLTQRSLAPSGCPFAYRPQGDESIDATSIRWSLVGPSPAGTLNPAPGADPGHTSARAGLTAQLQATSKGQPISRTVTTSAVAVGDLTAATLQVAWSAA